MNETPYVVKDDPKRFRDLSDEMKRRTAKGVNGVIILWDGNGFSCFGWAWAENPTPAPVAVMAAANYMAIHDAPVEFIPDEKPQ